MSGPYGRPQSHPHPGAAGGLPANAPPPPWGQAAASKKPPTQMILLVVVGVVCLSIFVTGVVLFATTKF